MVPIIHKACGKQMAWYLRDKPREDDSVRADDFQRIDGTQPKDGEIFREICPACGEKVGGVLDMERDFEGRKQCQE